MLRRSTTNEEKDEDKEESAEEKAQRERARRLQASGSIMPGQGSSGAQSGQADVSYYAIEGQAALPWASGSVQGYCVSAAAKAIQDLRKSTKDWLQRIAQLQLRPRRSHGSQLGGKSSNSSRRRSQGSTGDVRPSVKEAEPADLAQ